MDFYTGVLYCTFLHLHVLPIHESIVPRFLCETQKKPQQRAVAPSTSIHGFLLNWIACRSGYFTGWIRTMWMWPAPRCIVQHVAVWWHFPQFLLEKIAITAVYRAWCQETFVFILLVSTELAMASPDELMSDRSHVTARWNRILMQRALELAEGTACILTVALLNVAECFFMFLLYLSGIFHVTLNFPVWGWSGQSCCIFTNSTVNLQ